jgi:diguanylate cyclase (GGDEF)-like protein
MARPSHPSRSLALALRLLCGAPMNRLLPWHLFPNGNAVQTPAGGSPARSDLADLLAELIEIGIALTSERDLRRLLERIVREARRFTRAEAGALMLRDGDMLKFTVVQDDRARGAGSSCANPAARVDGVPITGTSLAALAARTGTVLNLGDIDGDGSATHGPGGSRGAGFLDIVTGEAARSRTRSVLVVPLMDATEQVLAVLELVNAVDDEGRIVPFDPGYEGLIRALGSQAAMVIRNGRLEELSFKDPLTDVYNRRYLKLRIDEECRRHVRFGHSLGLVLLDVDCLKQVNDRFGHDAGDDVLRDVAHVVMNQSRCFTTVTRYGGDEFAVLLANTAKSGAVTYAQRIKAAIEEHQFRYGAVTISVGVAALPDDASLPEHLMSAADRALYEAKRRGRNQVVAV